MGTQLTAWDVFRSTGLSGLVIVIAAVVLLLKGLSLLGGARDRGAFILYAIVACLPLAIAFFGIYMTSLQQQDLVQAMGGAAIPADFERFRAVQGALLLMGIGASVPFLVLGLIGFFTRGDGPERRSD